MNKDSSYFHSNHSLYFCLRESKASEMMVYDVSEIVSYTSCVVILTASSASHVRSVVNRIELYFKEQTIAPYIRVRKQDNYNWVVLDYQEVVIHCFQAAERKYYDLDGYFQSMLSDDRWFMIEE